MNIEWIAELDDGTLLHQFDLEGKEHLYKEVRFERLVKFTLKSDKNIISVFPITGDISINDTFIKYYKFKTQTKFELIYFIRRVCDFAPQGVTNTRSTWNIGLKTRGETNKIPAHHFIVKNYEEQLEVETK